jgi:hypothetical protein
MKGYYASETSLLGRVARMKECCLPFTTNRNGSLVLIGAQPPGAGRRAAKSGSSAHWNACQEAAISAMR